MILKGKRKLEGLPAVYTESDEEAETLEIYLRDRVMNTKIILSYTIFENLPVIIRNTRFVYEGESSIVLERAMSLKLDLPDDRYDMFELTGAWVRERYFTTAPHHEGMKAIYSMREQSSH